MDVSAFPNVDCLKNFWEVVILSTDVNSGHSNCCPRRPQGPSCVLLDDGARRVAEGREPKISRCGLAKKTRLCESWQSEGPRRTFNPAHQRTGVAAPMAAILARAAGRALASSVLGLRGCGGVDGDISQSHDVVREWRHIS